MKNTLTIILTILSYAVFGQQLKFNNEFVDTIIIRSHLSVYQFNEKGTTIGKADIISMTFNQNENQYFIDRFYRDEYKRSIKPDTINLKTKVYKTKIGKSMESIGIKALLTSLSNEVKSQKLFEQADTTELKNYLTNKQIRKAAKRYNIDLYFKRRYSSKEENDEFFKFCKSMDTLKLYLAEEFDNSGYVITDYTSTINIWISTTQSEYRFEGKYPNPIKQPWYDHSDASQAIGHSVLNLNINESLSNLLPKDFLLKETISNEALVNDYISWYFERRGMIN